jgi:predicted nucleic acid-binding protein
VTVIDTSAYVQYLFREEGWERLIPHLAPRAAPVTVEMLWIETLNVIWKNRMRGTIDQEGAAAVIGHLKEMREAGLLAYHSNEPYSDRAFEIACAARVSVYDAHFIALAESLAESLLTADRKQGEAARDIGVATIVL